MDKSAKKTDDVEHQKSDCRSSGEEVCEMSRNPFARLFAGWSTRELVAEFLGTFILMVIMNSVAAVYTIQKPSPGETRLAMGYVSGIGAMIGIMLAMPISGGHVNPAVTIAFATCGKLKWNKVFHYLSGQYFGSFAAQFMVWTLYREHIRDFDGGDRSAYGLVTSTGKIFTTFPAPGASLVTCIADQMFGAFILLLGVCTIISEKGMRIPAHLQPFLISLLLTGYGIALGYNSGGINPARDLSPRIFTILVGYGMQAFRPMDGHYWYAVGVFAPHAGAILGVLTFDFLIERNLDEDGDDEIDSSLLANMREYC